MYYSLERGLPLSFCFSFEKIVLFFHQVIILNTSFFLVIFSSFYLGLLELTWRAACIKFWYETCSEYLFYIIDLTWSRWGLTFNLFNSWNSWYNLFSVFLAVVCRWVRCTIIPEVSCLWLSLCLSPCVCNLYFIYQKMLFCDAKLMEVCDVFLYKSDFY